MRTFWKSAPHQPGAPSAKRLAMMLAVFALLVGLQQPAMAGDPPAWAGGIRPANFAKSKLVQDPAWIGRKIADARRNAARAPRDPVLDTSYVRYIVEPEGASEHDDAGTPYTDSNYWLFCSAGAATAVLTYWDFSRLSTMTGTYVEPNGSPSATTYWNAADTDYLRGYSTKARAYLMYIAEYTVPPSYGTRGEVTFGGANGPYGTLPDLRDALNWEASGHNTSTWSSYFYATFYAGSLTQADLHTYISSDIATHLAPVAAFVLTKDLSPNWPSTSTVIHAITIVGYDDSVSPATYTYIDTCGHQCGASSNGGVYTVSQAALWQGILDAASQGGSTAGGIDW
jgi:hypothetical protein